MTEISIDVGQESELWGDLAVFDALAQKAIDMAARMAGVALMDGAEVSVMLSDDARVREVNRAWRKMDKPTNVLSFPAAEAPCSIPRRSARKRRNCSGVENCLARISSLRVLGSPIISVRINADRCKRAEPSPTAAVTTMNAETSVRARPSKTHERSPA